LIRCAEDDFLNKVLPQTSSRHKRRWTTRVFIASLLRGKRHEEKIAIEIRDLVRSKQHQFYIWFTEVFSRSRHLVDHDTIYHEVYEVRGDGDPDLQVMRDIVKAPTLCVPAQPSPDSKIQRGPYR
jgi:hypothetical protein